MNFFSGFQPAWQSLFLEHDPSLIEWTTVCASQLVGFLLPGLIFFMLDLLQPAWAQPWRKPPQFPTHLKLWKMVRCSTRNMLTGWVLHGLYLWWAYPRTLFVVDSQLPTWKEAVRQYIGVFLLGEGLFYVGMSVWYGHVVDHLVFNGLPLALVTLVPAIVLQAHILVVEALSVLAHENPSKNLGAYAMMDLLFNSLF